ncbi:MAG: Bug family tripartite tricarboxylate transporter substrate binding protein, partial [Burkholderiales bacterium]
MAQSFPSKPIKVVAPFPPGSGPDAIVRMLGARIGESMGQPLVIENNGGANGTIGGAQVARAAPDGYTVIFGNTSTHVTSILMTKNTPYDP